MNTVIRILGMSGVIALVYQTSALYCCGADCKLAFRHARDVLEAKLGGRLEVGLEERRIGKTAIQEDLFSHSVSLFDRRRQVLVVDPGRLELLLAKAKTIKAREDRLFFLMLHELIHVYQDQILAKHSNRKVRGKWLRFVCEGHAICFSKKIGLESGLAREIIGEDVEKEREKDKLPRGGLSQVRKQLLYDFFYHLSARHVERLGIELKDFAKLLNEVPSFCQILGEGRTRHDPAETVEWMTSQEFPDLGLRSPPLELDYLDAMVLLCPEQFTNPSLVDAFLGGIYCEVHSGKGLKWEIGRFACRDEAGATELFDRSSQSFVARMKSSMKLIDKERFIVDGFPGNGRFFSVVRIKQNLICFDVPNSEKGWQVYAQVLSKATNFSARKSR